MQKFFSKGPKKENKKKKKRKKHESVLCLALSPKWLFSLLVWSASYFLWGDYIWALLCPTNKESYLSDDFTATRRKKSPVSFGRLRLAFGAAQMDLRWYLSGVVWTVPRYLLWFTWNHILQVTMRRDEDNGNDKRVVMRLPCGGHTACPGQWKSFMRVLLKLGNRTSKRKSESIDEVQI